MDKIISFGKGIRRQPSVGEDGELSELVNLIPKNGELVNVRPMGYYSSDKLRDSKDRLIAIHNVDGKKNVIARSDDSLYIVGGDDIMSVDGYKSIAVMGNTVVVSDDRGMKYAIWNGSKYDVFSQNDMAFKINVKSEEPRYVILTDEVELDISGIDRESYNYVFGYNDSIRVFNAMDAHINAHIAENETSMQDKLFKYTSVGIAALRLYDNSYVSYSNFFTIDHFLRRPFSECRMSKVETSDDNTVSKVRLQFEYGFGAYTISIEHEMPTSLLEFVAGVDIFLSKDSAFIDHDKGFKVSWELLNKSQSFSFQWEDAKKMIDELDGMFFKSISINVEEFGPEKYHNLQRVTGVEETLDLSEMSVFRYNTDSVFTYNSRINAAVINYMFNPIGDSMPRQIGLPYIIIPDFIKSNENIYYQGLYNRGLDSYIYDSTERGYLFKDDLMLEAVIEVDVEERGYKKETNRWAGMVKYPFPPIISFPTPYATELRIYIKDDREAQTEYLMGKFSLLSMPQSKSSVYINLDGGLGYTQANNIEITGVTDNGGGPVYTISIEINKNWKVVDESEYITAKDLVSEFKVVRSAKNIIKYSNAQNPFVFPVVNTLPVGNGEVLGVSTAVKALSPSQFGQFPLYAFCSDGIWALEVGNDGTYLMPKIVSNDICNNADSITQIESSVIFTTDQGLKLIQGSDVVLLSAQMDGHNINKKTFFPDKFFDTYNEAPFDMLVQQEERDFREILKTCNIAYDYASSLLRIFPRDKQKYYIYSLSTKEFSSAISDDVVTAVVADYLSPILQMRNDIFTFSNAVDNDTLRNGLLLTRPIDMGEPFAMKKLQDMKLHYTKHYKKKDAFDKKETFVKMVVYVSNDGENWYVLPSMRKRAFKYYRVALITKMTDNDALSGMIMRYELERTNKIR